MDYSDILLHLGEDAQKEIYPGSPELYQTSNFIFPNVDSMRDALKNEDTIPFYTRGTNPTVALLNKKVAALEGTENALSFASGSAAIANAVIANIQEGEHILSVSKPYSWSTKLMQNLLPKFGVEIDFHDAKNTDDFLSNIKSNTKIIFLESPNSWTYEMQDLEKIAEEARKLNITTILDNSYATPINQKASSYGIDIIAHSATKYYGGHSDLVAGILCGSNQMINKIFKSEYMTLGGILSPYDAWLMLRSLRTLPLRVNHIGETAMKIVTHFEGHPGIKKLFYPFSKHFDQKSLVKKYLTGPNGLFTFDLNSEDPEKIQSFCNSLKKFRLGCSWGSYESLAFPAITTVSSLNYDNPETVINRVRFSVGLDNSNTLINDLENAFDIL